MSSQEIVHAYRHLYRGLLHAVQFSNMARDPVRTTLREAFRDRKGTFDAQAVKRTLWFLDAAAKERGLEHKILKNLVRMARQRQKSMPWKLRFHLQNVASHAKPDVLAAEETKANVYQHYDMTVAMLNKSMGLCLR